MNKLRFKVVYSSSEYPGYPADELNNHGPQTKGWLSDRFASFPQEIGLQLENYDATIQQVQILSHQSKIATKIEIHIGAGRRYDEVAFKRLGYLSLDSNERSNYQARELKTVYLNHTGNFVKLIIHQNHVNSQNYYNQVGIVAINLLGTEPDSQNGNDDGYNNPPRRPVVNSSGLNDLSIDMNLDPQTATKIRQLVEAKNKAVANEDYVLAKHIKAVEAELKQMGSQLASLDAQKRRAVEMEDYDRAKSLKDDVDHLRQEIERKVRAINIPGLSDSRHARSLQTNRSPGQDDPYLANPQHSARRGIGSDEVSPMRPGDGNEEYNGGYNNNYYESPMNRSMGEVDDGSERPIRPKPTQHYNDPDPAVEGSQQNYDHNELFPDGEHPLEGVDNCDKLPEPEDLSTKAREAADQNMLALIGDYRARCLFSKTWVLREAAITKVRLMLQVQWEQDINSVAASLMTIVRVGLEDKMQQVYFSSITLLESLLSSAKKLKLSKVNPSQLEHIIVTLLEKLADANSRIRDSAKRTLDVLMHSPCVGPYPIAHLVMKPLNAKQASNWRAIAGKLNTLTDVVKAFGVGGAIGYSHENIMQYIKTIAAFDNGSGEVRLAAKELTVAVQRIVGTPAIEVFIKDLRDKQIEELNAAFETTNPGGGGISRKAPSKMSNTPTNTYAAKSDSKGYDDKKPKQNSPGAKQASQPVQNSPQQQRHHPHSHSPQHHSPHHHQNQSGDEADDFTRCLFCGKSNPTWNEESLDVHYVEECPYLTACPGCSQFIEVAAIPQHLLEECEHRDEYETCEVTGLAIKKSEMRQWKNSPSCRQPPDDCLVCPLCMSSVEDSDEAWRQHLMEGCPKRRIVQ